MTKTGTSYQIFNQNLTKFCVLQKTKWKIIFIIYDKYQSIPITTREKTAKKVRNITLSFHVSLQETSNAHILFPLLSFPSYNCKNTG